MLRRHPGPNTSSIPLLRLFHLGLALLCLMSTGGILLDLTVSTLQVALRYRKNRLPLLLCPVELAADSLIGPLLLGAGPLDLLDLACQTLFILYSLSRIKLRQYIGAAEALHR